jgi:hypothetical protein
LENSYVSSIRYAEKSKGILLKISIISKKFKVNKKTMDLIEWDQLPMLRALILSIPNRHSPVA